MRLKIHQTKEVSPGDRIPVSCLGESVDMYHTYPELSRTRSHSTNPSSIFVRNPFLCSFCHYPEIIHHLVSSLFLVFHPAMQHHTVLPCACPAQPPCMVPWPQVPGEPGNTLMQPWQGHVFVWMFKQKDMGLPCAKSSFDYIC